MNMHVFKGAVKESLSDNSVMYSSMECMNWS